MEVVVVRTFQKALTHQVAEAARTKNKGEEFLLNAKGYFIRCAVQLQSVQDKFRKISDKDQERGTTSYRVRSMSSRVY